LLAHRTARPAAAGTMTISIILPIFFFQGVAMPVNGLIGG
jgi:hypothetical protein